MPIHKKAQRGEMENNNYKINKQCIQNLIFISNELLPLVETKGDSTMIIYKIRLSLASTLDQIQKDNAPPEGDKEGITIDNTKKEE